MPITRTVASLLVALALCAAVAPRVAAQAAAAPAATPPPAAEKPEAKGPDADGTIYQCNFAQGLEGWGPYGQNIAVADLPQEDGVPGEGKALKLTVNFPVEEGCVRLPRRFRWKDAHTLQTRVFVPRAAEGRVQMTAYIVDDDYHWYQSSRLIEPAKGRWSLLQLDISPDSVDWAPVDHFKPWSGDVTNHVIEFGFKIFGKAEYKGPVYLADVAVTRRVRPAGPLRILNFRTSATHVPQYEKFEITFSLSREYENPFNPDEIDITANFISPSGEVATVPAFFYQDYSRRLEENSDLLTPLGRGEWKIRFAPQRPGDYRYMITVNDGERLSTNPRTLACTPSENPGYVRVSRADKRYFEFDNGDWFYPIGHNIPATYNVKAAETLGLHVLQHEGTFAYDRFIAGMGKAEENFARIWLAAWSFGLEWSTRYDPAYKGLGRYNMENAWRLDYVLDQCHRNGIYVQLTLTTFGHYRSETKEGDWDYSPYNIRNGGFLYQPQEFWSNDRAQTFYKRMLRYVMARWGYSTTVASWELSNEIDLVTGYGNLRPQIIRWHTDCADWIKRFDQGRHLITTNFASWGHEPDICRLPAIDYTSTNRYETQVPQILQQVWNLKSQYAKPALVTETGEDFKGSSADTTERYIQICIWSSYMMPFCGSAMQWWWDFIEDRDLYHYFTPLVKFAKGEDRREQGYDIGSGYAVRTGKSEVISNVALCVLKNRRKGFAWVYDTAIVTTDLGRSLDEHKDVDVLLSGFDNGAYQIEFWDTLSGKVIGTLPITTTSGSLRFSLPPFRSNMALKVKPVKG